MTRGKTIKIAIAAMTAIIGAGAATCDTGEDSHPSAPQVPGPERGGPNPPPQGNPQPAAGDPGPHIAELKQRIKLDPSVIGYVVIWDRERAFVIHWRDSDGREISETVRAQTPTGGTWTKILPARRGQTYGYLATPRDLPMGGEGTASCWIYHASATATNTVADWHQVPSGPCAVSYTIPV